MLDPAGRAKEKTRCTFFIYIDKYKLELTNMINNCLYHV